MIRSETRVAHPLTLAGRAATNRVRSLPADRSRPRRRSATRGAKKRIAAAPAARRLREGQPRSAARQASSARGSKVEVKKERSASKLRAWWRDFQDSQRDSSQDEDALIGRALHQHKLHFSEVYGLRRDQSGRIFLKNDRLVFHEGE
jgi:hypothetical protein